MRATGRSETRAAQAFVAFARERSVIVRWGLDELAGLLAELAIERPFLVASARWDDLPLPQAGRWIEVPSDRIADVAAAAAGADGLLAVGGGSAIDIAKAVSRRDRPAARLRADDVLGRGVDGILRRPRPRAADAGRRRRRAPRRDRLRAAS